MDVAVRPQGEVRVAAGGSGGASSVTTLLNTLAVHMGLFKECMMMRFLVWIRFMDKSVCNNKNVDFSRDLQYVQCVSRGTRFFIFYLQASKSYAQVQSGLNLTATATDCHWAPRTDDLRQKHIFPLQINSFTCRPHIQARSLSCTSASADKVSGGGPPASPPLEMKCLCIHTDT